MLKFAGKTTFGFWMFLPFIGANIFHHVTYSQMYFGDAVLVIRSFSLFYWMMALIIAGVAATDAARHTPPQGYSIYVNKISSVRTSIFLSLSIWIPIALVHVISILIALLYSVEIIRDFQTLGLAVLVQLLGYLFAAVFGVFIGRFVPLLLAGIVSIVSLYVLFQFFLNLSDSKANFKVLGDFGASVSQVGLGWNMTHLLLQIALLILCCLVFLFLTYQVPLNTFWKVLALSLTLVITMGILFLAKYRIPGTFMVENNVKADHCQQGIVEICVFEEHRASAAPTVELLSALYEGADKKGYSAFIPLKAVETSVRGEVDSNDGVHYFLAETGNGVYPPETLIEYLIMPGHCSALSSEFVPPESYSKDMDALIRTWLVNSEVKFTNWWGGSLKEGLFSPKEVEEVIARWKQCKL